MTNKNGTGSYPGYPEGLWLPGRGVAHRQGDRSAGDAIVGRGQE